LAGKSALGSETERKWGKVRMNKAIFGRGMCSTAIGLAFACGSFTPAIAQDFDASNLVDDVVVTATKTPTKISDIPASVTVITAEEIEAQGVASLTQILSRVPGVSITSFGGIGGSGSIRMRGMDKSHTLVLIDGIRQNVQSYGFATAETEHLSVHNIERIEVIRGPQATLYGSAASGGVINIIMKRGSDEGLHGSVKAEYGSYATRRLDANVSYGGKIGEMPFKVAYGHSEFLANGPSVADKKRHLTAGQVAPSEDDRRQLYNHSLNFELTPTEGVHGRIFGTFADLSTDLDTSGGKDADRNKDKRQYSYGTSWDIDTLDGKLKHVITASGTTYKTDLWRSGYPATQGHYATYRGQAFDLSYQNTYEFNDNHKLTSGIGWTADRFKQLDKDWTIKRDNGRQIDFRQYHSNYYTQLQSSFLDKSVNVVTGLSYDSYSDTEGKLTYRGGVSYLVPWTGTTLKTSYATGFVAPTPSQNGKYVNPEPLKPEETYLFDIGFEQPFLNRRYVFGATYFNNRSDNALQYAPDKATQCPTGDTCMVNLDEVKSQGLEVQFDGMLHEWETSSLDVAMTYTYTYTENADGGDAGYIPRNLLTIAPTYTFNDGKGMVRADALYYGRRNNRYSHDVTPRDGGEWVFGISANYEIFDGVTGYVRGENILDSDHSTSTGYTGTPRGFYAGVGYKF